MTPGTDIKPYLFEGEHLVRTVDRSNEVWFVAVDICRILGLKNPSDAIGKLDDDEKALATTEGFGRGSGANIVSEAGVYRLVFTSRKPIAERFKRWLAHEVIPSIRRTGSYGPAGAPIGAPANEALPFPNWPMDEMRTKLKCVDGYRLLYGIMAAQWISPQLGFPSPPPEYVERGRQFTLTLVPNPPKDEDEEKEAA